ncbi:MAG: DUF5069 domain-containing protein [Candidatus Synoicihabitans palmerolidicus]|nr:DUF5069 domain-containing protein [Candidatus Synoicihabitans palmerolidicus]
MSSEQCPVTAYQETDGLRYFPRMLDKIRLHAQGVLRADFHENLGGGLDGWMCDFMRIDYAELVDRTKQGASDTDLLAWCQADGGGRDLNSSDIKGWNHLVTKLGWNDEATERVVMRKKESGLEDRDEIVTMIDYFEFDEGRRS